MPGELVDIFSLTLKQWQNIQGPYFPGLPGRCDPAGRARFTSWKGSVHKLPVGRGSAHETSTSQTWYRASQFAKLRTPICVQNFNMLLLSYIFFLSSRVVDVYQASLRPWSGLSMNPTNALKIGVHKYLQLLFLQRFFLQKYFQHRRFQVVKGHCLKINRVNWSLPDAL